MNDLEAIDYLVDEARKTTARWVSGLNDAGLEVNYIAGNHTTLMALLDEIRQEIRLLRELIASERDRR